MTIPMRDGWMVHSDIVPDVAAKAVVEGGRFGSWMQTYTGRQFWPMDPRASEIDIEDIAHSLSMQCRYAGHCEAFYSVAEHSVHVAEWLQAGGMPHLVVLQGLLHDAPEAYLVDVPRPVKPFLTGYKAAEEAVWKQVALRFGIPETLSPAVHEADSRILHDERAQNMRPCATDWDLVGEPLYIDLDLWTPTAAKREFLELFHELTEPTNAV